MNIQHEETGRLQEWPAAKPIPHGWQRVSEPFLPPPSKAAALAEALLDVFRNRTSYVHNLPHVEQRAIVAEIIDRHMQPLREAAELAITWFEMPIDYHNEMEGVAAGVRALKALRAALEMEGK